MSRNGSGVYTKVNTFVSGNPVTAAGHNQNWDDLATEMTNSVAADGQTSLTGPLKAASGTVGAPGITFASDPDSGLYRIGSNNVGVAVNGAKVADIATTGMSITGTLTASSTLTASNALAVTAGGATITAGGVTITAGGLTVSADTIIAPVGSVGTPAYSFANDPNTGIYRIGADNIGISCGGVTIANISSAGVAVTGTVSGTDVNATNVASQAEQETASSTTKFVSPARQQSHPGHPKAWGYVTLSGGVATLATGYNVASVNRTTAGIVQVNFTTAFANAQFAAVGTITQALPALLSTITTISLATGTVTFHTCTALNSTNTTASSTDLSFSFVCFGDQ
jgi:hypothetical protein